jgi:hypothetical protein
MRHHAWLIACLLWHGSALPDTWSGMASKIPGVELLSISKDDSGAYVGLLDGESKEFRSHCTRGGVVHLSGFKAPAKCQMGNTDIQGEFFEIKLVTKEPLQGSGLFVMSKNVIPPRIQPSDFTVEEAELLAIAERKSLLSINKEDLSCFQKMHKNSDGISGKSDQQAGRTADKVESYYRREHESYVRLVKSSDLYKKFMGKKFKISTPNGFLYISSVGLNTCDHLGWDIVNVVYSLAKDTLAEVTRFNGCIEGGFRDLNGDGVPEVLTRYCENSESMPNYYWTIVPKAKVLLQR